MSGSASCKRSVAYVAGALLLLLVIIAIGVALDALLGWVGTAITCALAFLNGWLYTGWALERRTRG